MDKPYRKFTIKILCVVTHKFFRKIRMHFHCKIFIIMCKLTLVRNMKKYLNFIKFRYGGL